MKKLAFKAITCGLVLILWAVFGGAGLIGQENRMKVILDTDIGGDIDDAWALAFVIAHRPFEPLGITIADGNTPARARVACKLLHRTGRGDIPVLVGRQTSNQVDYQFAWAEDFTAQKPSPQPAADFIVQTIKHYPGEVTLIAVGPLQNVADALRQAPDLGRYVKRVVLMSGCVYKTSSQPTPVAEWNVRAAIADAQVVYAAGLPLTIVPLDSTTYVQLKDDEREQVRRYRSPLETKVALGIEALGIDG